MPNWGNGLIHNEGMIAFFVQFPTGNRATYHMQDQLQGTRSCPFGKGKREIAYTN
jgi:hypothetical protein